MRVVSAYRPFEPESHAHRLLGPFDWPRALEMLAESVTRSCRCETVALTDRLTELPIRAFRYDSSASRLMLWILDVSLRYLESPDFDRDTVFVSPDTLVTGALSPYFAGDLTLLIRPVPKYAKRPILNAAQWWPVASKDRLIGFYRAALQTACELPEGFIEWGADSEALRRLVHPTTPGLHERAGLSVSMVLSSDVLQSISTRMIAGLDSGRPLPPPPVPIVDFKYTRKRFMAQYFEALFPQAVTR